MAEELGFRRNLDGHHDTSLDLLRHVYARTEETLRRTAAALDGATDAAAVRAHQARTRAAVLAGLGGLPELPADPPPVQWRGPAEAMGCVVEQLVLETHPGVPVPATLYRPTTGGGPRPAVLFVCGHTTTGRADPEYQRVCSRLARAGLVVLAIDPWGQGERLGYLGPDGTPTVDPGTAEHTYAGLQAWWLGQSIARWFVHDARRAIDLLQTLPDVDPSRIGITGNSGGGTLCTLMVAIEDRLAAAAIGTFVTSRGAYLWSGQHQDAEQVLLGGSAAGVDHADLLAAMAPRPLAVLAAEHDFFPLEGTVESVERARAAYRALDAVDRLELHTAPVTHRYARPLAAAAARFFCAALGLPEPTDDDDSEPLPPEAMRALPRGQVALDRPGSLFLHDLVRADAEGLPTPSPAEARAWLRARVHTGRRAPGAAYPRWLPGPAGTVHGMWRSEADLWGAGVLLPPTSGAGAPRPLRIVLLDAGTPALTSDHPLARERGAEAVLVLDVRGHGALAVHDKDNRDHRDHRSAVYKLLCDLLWLDDSLAAARAYDIARAIDVALTDPHLTTLVPGLGPTSPVHLEAEGPLAFVAKVAAAVDDRVTRVTVHDDVVDPAAILRRRLHDTGDGSWQSVVPGAATHAPLTTLHTLLGPRLHTAG